MSPVEIVGILVAGWVLFGMTLGFFWTALGHDGQDIAPFILIIWPVGLPILLAALIIWGSIELGTAIGKRIGGES